MKNLDSISRIPLSLLLGIMLLAAGRSYGETITDTYYVAGKLRPILAIQAGAMGW